eukprot:CAMPEP_0183304226 /NCGR_PEP_ID=MMETSP0160_2-20130417/9381_1 /TAXON_ID=2839 ORGANISM="Odontella Sinensis, Strain Grunow 1884" /NCGR_SAMPLE_ID=MMETSP0160_2 /ASSEMBLY_ACC=CAM_ASM_000250 /LENGTH=163 /DNA_ID=CAMNT_0025467235 /DNA_START=985 /DNA_END=1473 /DNA_ORIENTATION=+
MVYAILQHLDAFCIALSKTCDFKYFSLMACTLQGGHGHAKYEERRRHSNAEKQRRHSDAEKWRQCSDPEEWRRRSDPEERRWRRRRRGIGAEGDALLFFVGDGGDGEGVRGRSRCRTVNNDAARFASGDVDADGNAGVRGEGSPGHDNGGNCDSDLLIVPKSF